LFEAFTEASLVNWKDFGIQQNSLHGSSFCFRKSDRNEHFYCTS